MFNPYQNQMLLRQEIIHVNGENGARALQMAPNSNALLLDDTAPIIWLAQTDGAGYKTVNPFKIEPYQPEAPIDTKTLEMRIARLEGLINESNNANAKHETKSDDAVNEPIGIA